MTQGGRGDGKPSWRSWARALRSAWSADAPRRGPGHDDRLLPRLTNGIPLVGVALDELAVERLPTGAHDAAVTHRLTPTGIRAIDDPSPDGGTRRATTTPACAGPPRS